MGFFLYFLRTRNVEDSLDEGIQRPNGSLKIITIIDPFIEARDLRKNSIESRVSGAGKGVKKYGGVQTFAEVNEMKSSLTVITNCQ